MALTARSLHREQMRKLRKQMKFKRRAVEVKFSNGEILIVHEPSMGNLGVFLRAMPSLDAMGKAFKALDAQQQGVIGVPIDLPDSLLEGIYPLFGVMTEMTVDEFKALPLWDGLGVLRAFGEFAPNTAAATETDSNSTPTPPMPAD